MDMVSVAAQVRRHYDRPDLDTTIFARLAELGKQPDELTYLDLTPFDQFHTRGRTATLELAQLADLRPGLDVLDVGGGSVGPPARWLPSLVAG